MAKAWTFVKPQITVFPDNGIRPFNISEPSWCGAMLTKPTSGTTFMTVNASFTVPTINPPPAAWAYGIENLQPATYQILVGCSMDAASAESYFRAGVQISLYVDGETEPAPVLGPQTVTPFVQWYPNAPVLLNASESWGWDTVYNVNMCTFEGASFATATVSELNSNLTTGSQSFSAPEGVTVLGQDVEWFVEQSIFLPQFSIIGFFDTYATTGDGTDNLSSPYVEYVNMVFGGVEQALAFGVGPENLFCSWQTTAELP
jgi:Peptidase A4 family